MTGKHDLSDSYNEAENADERHDLIDKVVGRYRDAAKHRLFEEFPWIEETAARLKRERLSRELVVAP